MSQLANTPPQPRGYRERKLAGLCAQNGCANPPADDSDRCEKHRDRQRLASAKSAKRRRRANRRAGRCAECPTPSKDYLCPKCTVRLGRTPRHAVETTVETSDRIRTHADGRTRFHGQMKRGRQANSNLDEQDLLAARKHLERGRAGLAYYNTPAVRELPRIQRDAVKRAALAEIDLARRLLEDVLERHRYDEDLARAAPRPR